jgi:hypothetical protein
VYCNKFRLHKYTKAEYANMEKRHHLNEPGLSSEEAKELVLDEEARPIKKLARPPIPTEESKSTHKKIKGTRKL